MKLFELHSKQDTIVRKFGLGDHDADDVLAFVNGETDWESLSDEAREKLYSHYEKSPAHGFSRDDVEDPMKFILPALKKDFGL